MNDNGSDRTVQMDVANSEALKEHENKVDGYDDEGLTTVDLATRTVTVGTTRVDWMDEMWEDMEARDEERAAVCLATVRPAVATTRFSRSAREEEQRRRFARLGRQVRESVQAGEGAERSAAGEGAERPVVGESDVVVDGTAENDEDSGTTATIDTGNDADANRCNEDASTTDAGPRSECCADHNRVADCGDADSQRLRLERQQERRKRKMKKRKRVLRACAKLERAGRAMRRKEKDVQQTTRERDATAALVKLQERREQRKRDEEPHSGLKSACVSLVQRGNDLDDESAAQYVGAEDGLPTASMLIDGEPKLIKLDSCARYSVAGTTWMQYGDKLPDDAPVDYVEGIGGFLLDVLGVWRFRFENVFGEMISVDACIVSGCTEEFLLGVDFLTKKKANMDFERSEVKYTEDGRVVVIPFITEQDSSDAKAAAVRVAGKTRIAARAVTPIEISVAAKDGERGIFIPTHATGAVLLAATLTTAHGGRAWVPAINSNGTPARLPNKKELGTWLPVDDDMTILDVNSHMDISRLDEWIKSLGDDETPLDNEDEVQIGVEDPAARELMKRLLRVYRKLSADTSDCPPATALNVQHHIDTGDTAPIMMKRRRHAQSEDQITEENVDKMLKAGVIEEGDGAWGFPVVLVRKKDGEVRFCIDYRALNKVTKKDVYPLPRIDETLEALGGALLFTTLDLKAGDRKSVV